MTGRTFFADPARGRIVVTDTDQARGEALRAGLKVLGPTQARHRTMPVGAHPDGRGWTIDMLAQDQNDWAESDRLSALLGDV